jgi:hypothetical protein
MCRLVETGGPSLILGEGSFSERWVSGSISDIVAASEDPVDTSLSGPCSSRLILQKYMSWLFATLTLVGLGSQILPRGLSEIGEWFGPLFGPAFRPELLLVFLLLGPPLSYTPLLMTWAAAGLVGGFFARGVKRSMIAGTLSTTTIILLIVANGFIIFTGLGGLVNGFSGLNIPPPPPGVTLADVLNAPLVSQGIGVIASGGGFNPVSILRSLVMNFAVNIAVHAGSFIISGLIFSKLLGARHSRISPPVQNQIQSQPTVPAAPVAAVLTLVAILLVSMIAAAPSGIAQAGSTNGVVPGEQLALNLQSDGSLKMTYTTNITALPGVPSDYSRAEFQGLVGGFLFAFNGSVDLGQGGSGGSGGSFSFLVPLLPPNGFLAAYAVPNQSTGKAKADVLASEFGQGFGVNLTPTVSMMLPSFGGQQVPGGSIYLGIYSGDSQPGKIGAKVLGLVNGTGVGSILTVQKLFLGQFGVQAGYVNFNVQSTGTPVFVPAVQMNANLTPLANFYGHGNFTLGLRETFGSQGTIGPSAVAHSTSLQLGFPTNSTVTGYRPTNATLNMAQGQLSYSMNMTAMPISNMYVNFTGTFPQRISIGRQVDPHPPVSSGTTVTETITVTNLGNQTIQGAVVSEKTLFQTYPTLQLLSPSQNVSLGDIPPQISANASIRFRVGSDGFYTLPPIQLTYTDQGQSVSKASAPAYLQSSFNLSLYLQELVKGTAPYSYLFLLLLVIPPVRQLPKLFHRSRPRGAYAPIPVAVGSGPTPSPTP